MGFVGFIVTPNSLTMEPDWIETVKSWPEPRSFRDIQVFLGFVNFYWCFIDRFLRLAWPLSSMLVGGKAGRFLGPFLLSSDA